MAVTKRRLTIGIVIVVSFVISQFAMQSTDHGFRGGELLFLTFELVGEVLILSSLFDVLLRRSLSHERALVVCAAGGLALSAAAGALAFRIAEHVPSLLHSLKLGGRPSQFGAAVRYALRFQFNYALWALVFLYPRLIAESERRKAELAELRRSAELSRLRASLEPHFLLNTLNAIAGLVTKDAEEARRLLASLGELLDETFSDGEEWQTLDHEIRWLKRYAEILEARHRGSLTFHWHIDDATRTARLPRLLLQPLVENAVKHGALCRARGGSVLVRSFRADDDRGPRVVCTVEDDGPGMSRETRQGARGIEIVRRRLRLNLPSSQLRLDSSSDGTRATIEIPL
ncbi:MAG: sensor histidine kinase [Labilithrix sp.]|nr:sensor histidine kinase [Labilithrix sp.]